MSNHQSPASEGYQASQSSMDVEPDLWCHESLELPLVRTDTYYDPESDITVSDDFPAFHEVFQETGEVLEDGRRIFTLNRNSRQYIRLCHIACMCGTCINLET